MIKFEAKLENGESRCQAYNPCTRKQCTLSSSHVIGMQGLQHILHSTEKYLDEDFPDYEARFDTIFHLSHNQLLWMWQVLRLEHKEVADKIEKLVRDIHPAVPEE